MNITVHDGYVKIQIEQKIYNLLERKLKKICEEDKPLQALLSKLSEFLTEDKRYFLKYNDFSVEKLIRTTIKVDPVTKYKLETISRHERATVSYVIREYLRQHLSNLEQILNSVGDPVYQYYQTDTVNVVINEEESDKLDNILLKYTNYNRSSILRRVIYLLIKEYERSKGEIQVPDKVVKRMKAKE